MQKKIMMYKHDLEVILSHLEPHPSPKVYLEQYTIPADVAAEVLHLAAYTFNDILNKSVFDLGCGTGRLGIGAAILGAKEVVGIDIDPIAVKVARKNAKLVNVENVVSFVTSDIKAIVGKCDTIVQNPPFGVRKHAADRQFLFKALELGKVTYSLHKSGEKNRRFLQKFISKAGGKVGGVFQIKLIIPKTFHFHKKRKYLVNVDLYRIEGG